LAAFTINIAESNFRHTHRVEGGVGARHLFDYPIGLVSLPERVNSLHASSRNQTTKRNHFADNPELEIANLPNHAGRKTGNVMCGKVDDSETKFYFVHNPAIIVKCYILIHLD
jgi:hypothetical protein